jgi:uncharacterized membrane protein
MTENRMPGWRRIALPASIVLNLFLAALIGSHLLHGRRGEVNAATALTHALTNAEARLPPQDAAVFGASMRRDAPQFAEAARQLMEARAELVRQLVAEPFDQEAARLALATWRIGWGHFVDQFGNAFVDALAKVSPEGRRKLITERQSPPAQPAKP